MLLIFSSGQGAAVTGLNLAGAIADLYPALNASGTADLVFWTEAELYEWADEAAKRLARVQGGFVERDSSTTLVVGTHTYTLPARHLSTIHVSLGTRSLRPATVQELEAKDNAWVETAHATVSHWLGDAAGTESARLYPKPAAGAAGAVAVVFHRHPSAVEVGSAVVKAPLCLRDYWAFHVLGEARGREGKAAMPEVSEWCREMTALYERVCREYWGGAQ